MQQKLKDLLLLVKHERKWQLLLGGLVFVILLGIVVDDQPRRYGKAQTSEIGTVATSADNASDELLEFSIKQKAELEARINKLESEKKVILEKQKVTEDRTTKILSKIVDRVRKIEDSTDRLKNNNGHSIAPEAVDADQLEPMFPGSDADLVKAPLEPERERVAYIAAGDSVKVKLLSGVHARTDGTNYPVVFQLASDIYGPDGSALPLGEARIVAQSEGTLIDQRAIFRLEDLSVRLQDGSRKVVSVDGWIVGEDGIRGMEGILIDPIGKVLAGEGIAAGISGLGLGINQGSVTTFNGGGINFSEASNQAAGQAASGLGQGVSKYIQERSALLVPVVKVLSGREATAVFSKNVEIGGLLETLEEPNLVYASLD